MQAAHSRLLLAATILIGSMAALHAVTTENLSRAYTPLTIVRTTELHFPLRLISSYVGHGEARVMIMVDAQGRLADWFVTGYSHPLFVKEVLAELPKWKFHPAMLQGQPINTRTEVRFSFQINGAVRLIPVDGDMYLRMNDYGGREVFEQRMCKVGELDAPLDVVEEVAPMPPDQLGAVSREGKVVVDYFIDERGRVRMPVIVASDDAAFTQSVLLALTDWRYAPPTHSGQPVMTRVWRQFNFRPISSNPGEPSTVSLPDRDHT